MKIVEVSDHLNCPHVLESIDEQYFLTISNAGPLFQRKKIESAPQNVSLRRVHTSGSASDQSSLSGAATEPGIQMRRSTSRKKVVAVEEKPLGKCCGSNVRRSNFQAYGVVMSFIRICTYSLLIGGLRKWPAAQAGSCLGVAVAYLAYLRLVVPYSRRDEMALEYWIALLDVVIFGVLVGLVVGVGTSDFNSMDTFCIILIVFQGIGMFSYLINRVLIIVHAFSEVVCPACKCGAPSPKKSRKPRHHRRSRSGGSTLSRSESLTYSASDASVGMQAYYEGKGYYMNGGPDTKDIDSVSGRSDLPQPENGNQNYTPPKQAASMTPDGRSVSRSGRSGIFPAIIEEPGEHAAPQIMHEDLAVPAPRESQQSVRNEDPQQKKGQNAVFDKFWSSL